MPGLLKRETVRKQKYCLRRSDGGVMNTRRRLRVNKCEESDGSAGRKPSTICCLIPAVPPSSASLLPLLLPRFRPTNYHRIESIYCQISGGTRRRQNKSRPSLNLIFVFTLLFLPVFSFPNRVRRYANKQASHKRGYTDTHVCTLCVKRFL